MSIALTIAFLATAILCLEASGPVLIRELIPPPPLEQVISLFTPTLIASLVAPSTFSANGTLLIDERALGVGTGFIALYLRAPHLQQKFSPPQRVLLPDSSPEWPQLLLNTMHS